jgi:DNA-binding PadR family transcriptional regulator
VPAWQAASDRGDKFREHREKTRGKSAIPLCVSSDEIVAAVHEHVVTKPPEVKVARRYTHNRQPLTAEILLDAMTARLYEEVTMKFNFTADVCEQARVQIGYGFLEQYRVKTAATSFNGLMEELRPTEFSDDAGILISELAGWLLQCLVATGHKPEWMYWAFGAAGSRARQMEERASYDKRAATLANGDKVIYSVLDLFILSLLDRGLQTPYDLQRQGGLSLGSTVPALRRLETAGLIRKRKDTGASKRPRHSYQLSAAGRTRAQDCWKTYLKAPNQMDLDAVLRVADMAQYYNARTADMVEFFEAVVLERRVPGRLRILDSDGKSSSLGHMPTLRAWNAARLKAEAKFLAALAKSVTSTSASRSKR